MAQTAHPIRYYSAMVGGLSKPSKMPGWGYGLPALKSCAMGSKLSKIPGTPCYECYATRNRYNFRAVREAQNRRLQVVKHNPSWTKAMIGLIASKKEPYFRWHDSGDLISMEHLENIVAIAVALPGYYFWLPTQEHMLIRKYLSLGKTFPPNLTVRLSTPRIDGQPVTTPLCTSTIHRHKPPQGYACPAPTQGNKCGDCRACWDKGVKNVSYGFH